tara:strand:+ start:114936 stop:116795 length:1860 start_codon:yes stop_codon:yes gene_type:complete
VNSLVQKYLQYSGTEKRIILFLFILLWGFLFVRAVYVPVLHDEIATFFYYIQSDNYMPPGAHWDANNHVLNSMLANFSYHVFGSSPLALRLPNVLTYALFFYGVFQIAGRLNKKILRWGLLLALVASHYLFEYFGECRGYGMSIAFFVLAIFQFIRLKETGLRKHMLLVPLFLFLATAANLTLIIPAVLIFGFMCLFQLKQNFTDNKKVLLINGALLFFTGLPFLILVKLSFAFKERGAFYYGVGDGFYEVTVRSLSQVFMGFYNTPIAVVLTVLLIGFALYVLIKLIQKKTLYSTLDNASFFPTLLIANIACILFLFHKMEVNFPEDRIAIHLFFLFMASLAFILDDLSSKNAKIALVGIPLFYFPILFLFHATPTGSTFSSEERTPYPIYDYIANAENDFKFPISVGGYKTQEFCWYYLNNRNGGTQGKIHTNFHIAFDADFQIVRDGKIDDCTLFDYYDPVISDPATNLTLFERRNKLKKPLVFSADAKVTNGFISDEYHNILEMEVDSLEGQTLYIGAELTFEAIEKPFISWLAVTVNDVDGTSLYSDYVPLDWIRKHWDGTENNLVQGTLIHQIPEGAKTLKFHIWNIDKTSFSIRNGKCYLYHLERDFLNQYN